LLRALRLAQALAARSVPELVEGRFAAPGSAAVDLGAAVLNGSLGLLRALRLAQALAARSVPELVEGRFAAPGSAESHWLPSSERDRR
jgi:Na+/proline symporter